MLSHSQHEEFLAQGFLVFDPQIDERTLDKAAAAAARMYLHEGEKERGKLVVYRDNRRIQDAWKVEPSIKAIATAPRVLGLLQELYQRKPLPFQTLNFRVGTEQQPHSDTVHFNARPAGLMCGVWVALEDIDRDNGPVVYFPGSHRWKELTLADVDAWNAPKATPLQAISRATEWILGRKRDTDADYAIYEQLVRHRIAQMGTEAAYATIRKGQAFLWAANLLHGGSHQVDRSRTRASQVTHYFFEGCRYYTPLLQRGWKTHWRTPDWVTLDS
jgi:ectoine hydroxylase-related dioxygenase (phytanoyl-CoA dioxygenase family)